MDEKQGQILAQQVLPGGALVLEHLLERNSELDFSQELQYFVADVGFDIGEATARQLAVIGSSRMVASEA